MRKNKRPDFDRLSAAKQLSEAESRGFHEGMNTTVRPDRSNNPYSGWVIGGDAWDNALRDARERGWKRGQDLRRAEIKRICEAESEEQADG